MHQDLFVVMTGASGFEPESLVPSTKYLSFNTALSDAITYVIASLLGEQTMTGILA